jgi:hypothetical protein
LLRGSIRQDLDPVLGDRDQIRKNFTTEVWLNKYSDGLLATWCGEGAIRIVPMKIKYVQKNYKTWRIQAQEKDIQCPTTNSENNMRRTTIFSQIVIVLFTRGLSHLMIA